MPPERQGSGTNRRSFIKAVVASGGVVALAGCGEDADPVFADGGNEDAGDAPTGGVLNVASADDPENLDPHTTTINVAQLALENVVEGLFDLNEELEIEPLLASDYEVSDDNLVYDIELEEGIQFHDPVGGELTGDDVQYTIERILDPDLGSPRAANFEMIDEIETPDDYHVRFVLSEPFAPFLLAFTEGAGIVPADAANEVDLQRTPIGTGPFSFREWRVNEVLELERFGEYHSDGQPKLDEVIFNVVPESSTRMTRLNTGEAHVMYGIPFQSTDDIDGGTDTWLASAPSIWKQSLWFNTNEEPLNSRDVRRAINHAIDREQFVQGVLFGRGQAVHSPVPPTSAWNDRIDGGEPDDHDTARAEELLADAGYDPSDINLTIKASRTPGPTFADTATLVQSQLSQLGMNVEIEIRDFSTWLQEVWESNDFELSVGSWSGRIDPDGWYYRQYHSDGAWNHWGFANSEVDQLLEEGRTTMGTEERAEIYSQIDRLVSEELPMAYLYFREDLTGLRNEVGGYETTPMKQASFHETYLEE